jgi:Fe-S oxidoreductase
MAAAIRQRKVDAVERARTRSGAAIVASANPGCSMHLGATLDCRVAHPVDIVAEAVRR